MTRRLPWCVLGCLGVCLAALVCARLPCSARLPWCAGSVDMSLWARVCPGCWPCRLGIGLLARRYTLSIQTDLRPSHVRYPFFVCETRMAEGFNRGDTCLGRALNALNALSPFNKPQSRMCRTASQRPSLLRSRVVHDSSRRWQVSSTLRRLAVVSTEGWL